MIVAVFVAEYSKAGVQEATYLLDNHRVMVLSIENMNVDDQQFSRFSKNV